MLLRVNGQSVSVPDSLSDSSLLDLLRDRLGLKGTKFGCGKGLCGACTVHVDGVAMRSCLLTPRFIEQQEITTIEGLADTVPEDGLHPLQRSWIEESVPQCGYCQPGQIMAAASLLKQIPNPSNEEIEAGMSGNICRCGTYQRIRSAIRRVATETNE
ncbi:MAG: (2Fe-2S)-binding protein [Gammaproteobacteria bacterium]|nr:(2Fe-2S)-binding protein [Gammaproteobacteria bacterium]